ncbi:hypothetical protein B0H11DRAFT_2236634 [Mycena galericulata]|nr:hypothetical protein B0H11DRAFT_2236634 [Mycena galericulata]
MNNDNSAPRFTNAGPILHAMGLDSILPDHTLVVIIAFVLHETTHMPDIPHPNPNTNEIPVLHSMGLDNFLHAMGLDSILPDHTLVVTIAFVLDATHMPETPIPHHDHNMYERVVRDYIRADLARRERDLDDFFNDIALDAAPGNLDAAPGSWSSNMRAAAATLLAFFRDPQIVWACVLGGLVGVVIGLIRRN